MDRFQRFARLGDIPGVRINAPPHDRLVKLLTSPFIARQSERFAMGVSIVEPGKTHEVHSHPAEETIFVLSGVGEILINGTERVPLAPETAVVLRPDEPHGLTNSGEEPLRCLWVYAPSGPESGFAVGANCAVIQPQERE